MGPKIKSIIQLRSIVLAGLCGFILLLSCCQQVQCQEKSNVGYGPAFHNLTNCLYAYINNGNYKITFLDSPEEQVGPLLADKMTIDSKESECLTDSNRETNVIVNVDVGDNNMHSMSLKFKLRNLTTNHQWDISKVVLTIKPVNSQQFPEDVIELKPVTGSIYAPIYKSYSCSSLVLQNANPAHDKPHFKITLKRFQLQPFTELARTVFASSKDCSTWLTLPQIMGFLLVLFIIFTALFGVYLLLAVGSQQGEIRFSKQAGMLMNQAQLDATKSD